MDQQQHYVGLDVSLETTSICVIDDKGTVVWRGQVRLDPGIDRRGGAHLCPGRCPGRA